MEVKQAIGWDQVCHDVRNIICRHLNVQDLCNLSHVSRKWRTAALREKATRRYIQHLRFTFKFQRTVKGTVLESGVPHLAKVLDADPFVSLLIYDEKFENYETNVLDDFKDKLPQRMIVMIKVSEYLTMDDVQVDGAEEPCKPRKPNCYDIMGLFFPTNERRARVRLAWSRACYVDGQVETDRMVRQLGLLDESQSSGKSAMLIFADHSERSKYSATYKLVNYLQKRIEEGKETVWAGFGDKLSFMLDRQYRQYNSSLCTPPVLLAVRITGPNVKCWSTVINTSLPREEFNRKLREFKNTVIPTRDCTGLVYAPCCSFVNELLDSKVVSGDEFKREIMRSVKRMFREIPFLGMFDQNSWMSSFGQSFGNPGNYRRVYLLDHG